MIITLDLKTLGWALVIIGLLVLVVFCIIFMKNLIVTIRHMNQILEDTERISAIAAERTEQVNEAVGDVSESLSQVAEIIKGNQSITSALSSIVNALASLKNLVSRKAKDKSDKDD